MLFMNIYTFEPGQRNELLKRLMEKGMALPEGVKVLGNWNDIGGGRGFRLIESNDPKAQLAATMAWSDLMKIEAIPVIETVDVMKVAGKGKGSKK